MIWVYVDANVMLDFFRTASTDLKALQILIDLVDIGDAQIVITEQTLDEFQRRREDAIAAGREALKKQYLSITVPHLFDGFEQREDLEQAVSSARRAQASLLDRVADAARRRALQADSTVSSLLESAKVLKINDDALEAARWRVELGRPPGKGASIGDALSWETLLRQAPTGTDLVVITADSDFVSPLGGSLSQYLADEWSARVEGTARRFAKFEDYIRSERPEVAFPDDVRRDWAVRCLEESGSFRETRNTLRRLHRAYLGSIGLDEATRVLRAAVTNNQIRWILEDDDIQSMLWDLLQPHRANLDADSLDDFMAAAGWPF